MNVSLVDRIKALDAAYRNYMSIGMPITYEQIEQLHTALIQIANARNDLGIFSPDSN